jgi:hypothetical protein
LLHPFPDFGQNLQGFLGNLSLCIRTYIEQHIASLAYAFHQGTDELFGGFKVLVGRCIAPVVVHGYTGLPRDQLPFLIPDSLRGYDLFGGCEISGVGFRIIVITMLGQTVIYDDSRLNLAYHFNQPGSLPFFACHIII